MNDIHCCMTEQNILDFIPTGEENAVHSAEICTRFGLTERELAWRCCHGTALIGILPHRCA